MLLMQNCRLLLIYCELVYFTSRVYFDVLDVYYFGFSVLLCVLNIDLYDDPLFCSSKGNQTMLTAYEL